MKQLIPAILTYIRATQLPLYQCHIKVTSCAKCPYMFATQVTAQRSQVTSWCFLSVPPGVWEGHYLSRGQGQQCIVRTSGVLVYCMGTRDERAAL